MNTVTVTVASTLYNEIVGRSLWPLEGVRAARDDRHRQRQPVPLRARGRAKLMGRADAKRRATTRGPPATGAASRVNALRWPTKTIRGCGATHAVNCAPAQAGLERRE